MNERDKYIFPVVIRPEYVLGKVVIIVNTREELVDAICRGIDSSPVGRVLVEKQ